MKYSLVSFLLLLLIASCQDTPSQKVSTEITPEESKIAKDLIQGVFDDVWSDLDSTKIKKYHTDDFYILENGEHWTNKEIRFFLKDVLKNKGRAERRNRMEYITLEKQGEAISLAYNNYATFYQKDSLVGKAQWLESALAIPTEDGWKLRMMHSTFIPMKK